MSLMQILKDITDLKQYYVAGFQAQVAVDKKWSQGAAALLVNTTDGLDSGRQVALPSDTLKGLQKILFTLGSFAAMDIPFDKYLQQQEYRIPVTPSTNHMK